MYDGKYNYFNLNGPNIVMNKPRYREEEFRKKNTYNFVTDPRLKRGRNYGIVYVTSTAFDENDIAMKKLNSGMTSNNYTNENNYSNGSSLTGANQTKSKKRQQKINKEENLEQMGVPLPPGLESVGSMTTEIKEILPTPETFDMEVQTQDYIDLPQIPLFKPEKRGEDAGTQIEKGDLFDFDEEVEPIINVLTFKTLEEARMEVLEEEEIKEMKRQMQDFEKVRNRELEIVQKLECQTIRREEEKLRRNEERIIRTEMAKIYQKKLISCVFAKNYLKNIRVNALKDLEENGVLRKREKNEYHTKILPSIKEGCEKLLEEENSVLFGLDNLLENNYHDTIRNKHKNALENEQKRKDEEKQKKIEELKRQRDEKIRRRIERQRRKHEKEMEELKIQIKEELISKGEFIDSCNEIYNMNFYSQKELRGVPTILGHAGQIAINLSILRNCFIKIFTEPVEEKPAEEEKSPEEEKQPEIEEKEKSPERKEKSPEKEKKGEKGQAEKGQQPQPVVPEPAFLDFNETVKKLIDLYLLKASPFYFVLPNDVFDKIKAIDENISTIDDIWKVENEDNFKNIINLIFETNLQASIDPVIEMASNVLSQDFNAGDFRDIFNLIINNIFTICKSTTEFEPKDKIKFIQIANLQPDDNNYFGICDIKQSSIPKTKTSNDLAAQLMAKKNVGKKDAKGRPFFEPIFSEKVYITPLISDKMKIMAMSTNYERIFRNNLLSCLEKLESKFAAEGENLINTMDAGYNSFVEKLKKKLEEKYNKDVLEVVIESPNDIRQETK
jgi:hypothetical protein